MIKETRCIYFRHIISRDGSIAGESMFRIRSDSDNAANARLDAIEWAGKSGDMLKIGGGGQNTFAFHKDFVLDNAEIKVTENEFIFEIKLNGSPHSLNWQLQPGSEMIENGGITVRKMEYSCRNEETPDFPHEGEIIVDENGSRLICNSAKLVDEGNSYKKLYVSFKSLDNNPENGDNSGGNSGGNTSGGTAEDGYLCNTEFFYKDETLFCKGFFYWPKDIYFSKCAELSFWNPDAPAVWAGNDFVLEKMDSDKDGNSGYYVVLTARKIVNKLVKTEISEENSIKSATAFYHVRKTDISQYENLLGTTPVFVSGDYIVTKVVRKDLNPVMFEAAVTAEIKKGQLQIGETFCEKNETGINYRKAVFFVASDEVSSFRSELAVLTPAEWAGENYYIENFKEREESSGTVFEIKAVEIYTRMLSMTQTEKFSGYHADGTPFREVIYKSTWQVHADDINDFIGKSGLNADWCNDDAIVTEIIPVKKSDIEYEVKMEAQRRTNPNLHSFYNCENYSSLRNREDLDCKLVDFRFSPKDCGYYMHGDGLFDYIPAWQPAAECPLVSEEPLPPRFINAIVKIIRISETTYKKGGMHRVIDDIIEWCDVRVYNGRVGNYKGSFLKNDLFAKEIYDNHGVQWTKITKVYDLAPVDTQWNVYYFRQFDL